MSNDTDSCSSSSSSSEEYRKRRAQKEHRRKSEKKSKKQKKEKKHKSRKRKKRSSRSSGDDEQCPKLSSSTPTLQQHSATIAAPIASFDSFGPALPPHLMRKNTVNADVITSSEELEQRIIGPIIPTELLKSPKKQQEVEGEEATVAVEEADGSAELCADEDDDDSVGMFGPMPIQTGGTQMTTTQLELEERALQLKLEALTGSTSAGTDQQEREEWMLELPEVGLKGGLAALSSMKRTFHQGKERPDFSDRSSWTTTPQGAGKQRSASTSKATADSLKLNAEAKYVRERDKEQERLARKHKREQSLVEQHQKKLRKEQKQKAKELAEAGGKPERRPFSRDVDLKLNKIDKNQTKQIVDKAKILNTKFSTGHTKYL